MDFEVIWTLPSLDDMDEVAGFIALHSEAHAAEFVQKLRDVASSLSTFPDRGQVVPELGDEAIREILIKPYRIVYQVAGKRVLILAILHGAGRWLRY